MNPRHEKVNRHWTPDQIKLVRNRETFWGNLLAFINFNVILSETNNGFYVDIAIKENGKYLVQISGNNLSTGFQFSSLQTMSDDIRESRAQKIRDFQSQRDSKRKKTVEFPSLKRKRNSQNPDLTLLTIPSNFCLRI